MPFGDQHAPAADKRPTALYRRVFGSEDFHGHFRWNAVRRYVDPFARRTLEVGCGEGLMTIELAKSTAGKIWASELDTAKVESAQRVAAAAGLADRVTFTQRDLRELETDGVFDQVLAIDVLEHIDDDELAMRQIAGALRPGGRLVVSVPTPNYPVHFGRDFADAIGHVRDGYWFGDIEPKLEAAGFEVLAHHYYTGAAVSRVAERYYGLASPGNPYARALIHPVLRPALRLAERRAERDTSSSLALLAVRG